MGFLPCFALSGNHAEASGIIAASSLEIKPAAIKGSWGWCKAGEERTVGVVQLSW
jgi:hypothetical protein